MKVELQTGEVPNRQHVASFTIPDFHPVPEVIIWGIRVFKSVGQARDSSQVFYNECFYYAIPNIPTDHTFTMPLQSKPVDPDKLRNCKYCDCPIEEGEEENTFCRQRDGDLCERMTK